MRNLNVKVGTRTGRETLLLMRFGTEFEALRVKRVLDKLSEAGQINPRSYVVVGDCPWHGFEMIVVLPANTDHQAQCAALAGACRSQLDLNVQLREMPHGDYEAHALQARAARAGEN